MSGLLSTRIEIFCRIPGYTRFIALVHWYLYRSQLSGFVGPMSENFKFNFFILLQVRNHSNANMRVVTEGLRTPRIERNTHTYIHRTSPITAECMDVTNRIHTRRRCENT